MVYTIDQLPHLCAHAHKDFLRRGQLTAEQKCVQLPFEFSVSDVMS